MKFEYLYSKLQMVGTGKSKILTAYVFTVECPVMRRGGIS
jgi:hypothetical protein